jgi:hypothetical protein
VRSRVSEALEKLRECRPRCHLALRQLPLRFGEPPIAQVELIATYGREGRNNAPKSQRASEICLRLTDPPGKKH